jgi:hypothetical protein
MLNTEPRTLPYLNAKGNPKNKKFLVLYI